MLQHETLSRDARPLMHASIRTGIIEIIRDLVACGGISSRRQQDAIANVI